MSSELAARYGCLTNSSSVSSKTLARCISASSSVVHHKLSLCWGSNSWTSLVLEKLTLRCALPKWEPKIFCWELWWSFVGEEDCLRWRCSNDEGSVGSLLSVLTIMREHGATFPKPWIRIALRRGGRETMVASFFTQFERSSCAKDGCGRWYSHSWKA